MEKDRRSRDRYQCQKSYPEKSVKKIGKQAKRSRDHKKKLQISLNTHLKRPQGSIQQSLWIKNEIE